MSFDALFYIYKSIVYKLVSIVASWLKIFNQEVLGSKLASSNNNNKSIVYQNISNTRKHACTYTK
jgi:hypothetical protein